MNMTVEAIKDAVSQLPENDRHILTAWLNDLASDAWDREMASDFSPGGRGMVLVERVRREIREGKDVPFEEGRQAVLPLNSRRR